MLVDTGKDRQVLERGLARNGVTHLDAVYITHKDADHCGALPALTGVVSVDHVYVHADLLSNPVMEQVLEDARWVTGGRGAEGVRVGDVNAHRGRLRSRWSPPSGEARARTRTASSTCSNTMRRVMGFPSSGGF